MHPFLNFIRSYVKVTKQEEEIIMAHIREYAVPEGRHLFTQHMVCTEFVFITSGCLRFYYTPQDVEINVWFCFPNSVGSEVHSFISGQPCKFGVQAIYPAEVISITKQDFLKLRQVIPAFNDFYTAICEECILATISRLTAFQFQTAEERYRDLLQYPEYLKFLPQKYLASYLGITPTSLSRLRKKMASSAFIAK